MADKERRIPPKGTLQYRRYWRDKTMWQNLDAQLEQMQFIADNTDSVRKELFDQAVIFLKFASKVVKEGWHLDYIKSSEPDRGESDA